MKRKIAFALVSIALGGGAWSCLSLAQDQFFPARATTSPIGTAGNKRETVTSTLNALGGVESVTISGANLASTNLALVQGVNILEEKVVTLAHQLKLVEGAEKESVVANLKSAVGEQFDRRQESKMMELKALEEQLAKLKEIHNKRTQQRDQIIADRVQQIIREVDGLGWGTDSPDKMLQGRTNAYLDEASRNAKSRALWETKTTKPASVPALSTGL